MNGNFIAYNVLIKRWDYSHINHKIECISHLNFETVINTKFYKPTPISGSKTKLVGIKFYLLLSPGLTKTCVIEVHC